ncbi:MAG: phospho-sugar mutase, partial [Oscillospiraceae bacterium]|nr:phospho-sugar mutase [Oscillospiraceae bacterium]
MGGRPSFGTGGIRALMGEGPERFNLQLVREAGAGTALWALKKYGESAFERGIIVCRDTRLGSEEFSKAAAEGFASLGFNVRRFEAASPTPLLSFAVRELGACCGVSITASHNPPQYNGYKIYDARGVQLVPADAAEAAGEIERFCSLGEAVLAPFEGRAAGKTELLGRELSERFNSEILKIFPKAAAPEALRAVYSPLFGAAYEPVKDIASRAGFSFLKIVEEQSAPDGRFPGLKTPNPEDFSSFELAIKAARESEASLIFATDPDGDRLAACELFEGEYRPFSGSELGALLCDYVLRHFEGESGKKRIVFKTVVTGELGAAIARSRGCEVRETLTGFKFIGEQMEALSEGESFAFAYEESCGYLASGLVRDKDAVSSALLLLLAAAECRERGTALRGRLEELQREQGFFSGALESLPLEREAVHYMDAFRKSPPFSNCLAEDYSESLRGLPPAELIKYTLADGSTLAVRPSGTE